MYPYLGTQTIDKLIPAFLGFELKRMNNFSDNEAVIMIYQILNALNGYQFRGAFKIRNKSELMLGVYADIRR